MTTHKMKNESKTLLYSDYLTIYIIADQFSSVMIWKMFIIE